MNNIGLNFAADSVKIVALLGVFYRSLINFFLKRFYEFLLMLG